MKYDVFFASAITVFKIFFETWTSFHLLHILFLEPLHSVHDRHPYQRTCSHRPIYDLRSTDILLKE